MLIQTDNFGYNSVFRYRFHNDRYDYPMHIHHFTEIVVVLDGEIEILTEGRTELARAGDIAVISSFVMHGFRTPEHCNIWIAVFSNLYAGEFSGFLQTQRGIDMVFTPKPSLFAYLQDHWIYAENRSPLGDKAAIYTVLEAYNRLVPMQDTPCNESVLSSVFAYIHAHYKEPLTLSSVAHALGYSPNYISHQLGKIPNINFNTVLATVRIESAKTFMLSPNTSLLAIALECGFSNERSFYRSFQKIVGITPAKYRKTFADKL